MKYKHIEMIKHLVHKKAFTNATIAKLTFRILDMFLETLKDLKSFDFFWEFDMLIIATVVLLFSQNLSMLLSLHIQCKDMLYGLAVAC